MTTTRNRNEYSSPEILDYREDEELRYRENFEAEPDGTYARQNDHLVKFEDEMRQVDEQAASDFDRKVNPAEYSPERKRDLVEALEHAFNRTEWESASEQYRAADAVAERLFEPLYARIEMAEAAAQHRDPEAFIESGRQALAEHSEKLDGDVMAHKTEDHRIALRMARESREEGVNHSPNTEYLNHLRDQFAGTLHNSRWDEGRIGEMEAYLDRAIGYYNGEMPGMNDLEYRNGAAENLDFDRLREMNEFQTERTIRDFVAWRTDSAQNRLMEMARNDDPDLNAMREITQSYREIVQDGLQQALESGSEENFRRMMEHMTDPDWDPMSEFGERDGFVDPEGYRAPELDAGFDHPDQIEKYAAEARERLEDAGDRMSGVNYAVLRHLTDKLEGQRRRLQRHDGGRPSAHRGGLRGIPPHRRRRGFPAPAQGAGGRNSATRVETGARKEKQVEGPRNPRGPLHGRRSRDPA